jgi:hypothetical protein
MAHSKNKPYARHTVMVDGKVYSRLKSKGVFGESFSNLIGRILDEVEQGTKVEV